MSKKLEAIAETMAISTARFDHLYAAGHIHKNIIPHQMHPELFLHNRRQQRDPIMIQSQYGSPGRAKAGAAGQAEAQPESGRVPSMLAVTADPGAFAGRSDKNTADGLATSSRP